MAQNIAASVAAEVRSMTARRIFKATLLHISNSYKVRLIDAVFTSKVTTWGSGTGRQARKTTHEYRRNFIRNAAVNLEWRPEFCLDLPGVGNSQQHTIANS
jgi:hypothetical protein